MIVESDSNHKEILHCFSLTNPRVLTIVHDDINHQTDLEDEICAVYVSNDE